MVADGSEPKPNDSAESGGFGGYAAEREPVDGASSPHDAAPAAAMRELVERISEVRDYVVFYLRTRVDAIRVSVRNLLLWSVVIVGAMAAAAALGITAVVFLFMGVAQGLAELFGGRPWLGNIVTAVVMLGAIGAVTYAVVIRITKTSKQRMVNAYEERKRRQRRDHGIDAEQRAEQSQA